MKIIGHRGAKGLAPENTLASMQAALDNNVDAIEFDVRVTRDNVPVINHNPDIKPPGDVHGTPLIVANSTLAELRVIKSDLATLDEVFQFINQSVLLMVEIKSDVALPPTVAVLQHYLEQGYDPSKFWVGSKDFKSLQTLHKAFPNLNYIIIEPWSGVRAGWRARRLGATRIAMNQRWLWSGFISIVAKHNELYAYPLNDPAKAARWAKSGLAGVITDYPDRFKS